MQAFECTADIDATGALRLPKEIERLVAARRKIRVFVLLDDIDTQDQREWNSLSASEFLRGYSDDDSIYDTL
jgi:hypothetical protein